MNSEIVSIPIDENEDIKNIALQTLLKGDPPERGEDYWTKEDKQEVLNDVMLDIQPQIDEIGETAKTAISIAKGANQSLSFGDYATMVSVFNSLNNDIYRTGQNILIVTLNVPDLWVSAIAEESISYDYTIDEDLINLLKEQGFVQVGYYKLSQLETQKVDLKEYQKATELEERPFEITYEDGTTETLRSVVYK